MDPVPLVLASGPWCSVSGTFHRAVAETGVAEALAGSRGPGRYSRPDQPTLYLSASRAGVAAAMMAHDARGARRTILSFDVAAGRILDLRHPEALRSSGFTSADALGDWQAALAAGEEPLSWRVRAWIEAQGADGLIDPSRKAPGLWHLVLFRWNEPGGPAVLPAGRDQR